MASGYGIHGGSSRCYTMWQQFRKCYAQAECPEDCQLQLEDYMECLTHNKEVERARKIQSESVRLRMAARAEEKAASAAVQAASRTPTSAQSDPTNFMTRLRLLEEELKRKEEAKAQTATPVSS